MDQRGYRRYSSPTRASWSRSPKSCNGCGGSKETHNECRCTQADRRCPEKAVGGCEEDSGAGQERGQACCPQEAQAQCCWSQGDHSGHPQALGGFSEGWGE